MPQPLPIDRRSRPVRRELTPPPKRDPRLWAAALGGLLLAVSIPAATIWYLYRPGADTTVPLLAGTLEVSRTADALLIHREKIYTAPVSGTVRRLAEEGYRVRVGTPVVEIATAGGSAAPGAATAATPAAALGPAPVPPLLPDEADDALDEIARELYQAAASLNQARERGDGREAARLQEQLDALAQRQWELTRAQPAAPAVALPAAASVAADSTRVAADTAGIVLYQVDGLEASLNPDGVGAWKPSWHAALPAPNPDRAGVGTVTMGEPVFKVADSLSLGIVTVMPASALPTLPDGARVQIRTGSAAGRTITARLVTQVKEGDSVLLYVTATVFPEELAGLRKIRAEFIFAQYEGLTAPRSAIDVRGGVQGVWVQSGKEQRFTPVKVLGGTESRVALETDLPPGTRILKTAPQRMQ